MKLNSLLVAIAITFAASSANAATTPITFTGNTGVFGLSYSTLTNFADEFTFSVGSLSAVSVDADVLVGVKNLSTNAVITSFDLYDSGNNLLTTGSIAFGGALGLLSNSNLAAGSYYIKVVGSTLLPTGGSYSGNIDISPVPEPDTYAMVLAGLGLIGYMSKRRSNFA